jgi:hypothetical protein
MRLVSYERDTAGGRLLRGGDTVEVEIDGLARLVSRAGSE